MNRALFALVVVLVVLAGISCAILLAADLWHGVAVGQWMAVISALPLLAVGVAFLLFQVVRRPPKMDLLKNLLLAGTFLLWGCVQLMPQNSLSKKLGDVVIVLYVTDLAWMILARTSTPEKSVD